MTHYRVYRLNVENHITRADDIEAADDEEAYCLAVELHGKDARLEIWCSKRMVEALPGLQEQRGD